MITHTAFISTLRKDRERVRQLVGYQGIIDINNRCPIEVCRVGTPRGFISERAGGVEEFTGISSPYEPPERPDLILDTGSESLELCADQVITLLQQRGVMVKPKGKQT